MKLALRLLQVLSDGRFHSGQSLGDSFNVTRSAIWRALRSLQDLGLDVQAVPGRGYRLAAPVEILCESEIRSHLTPLAADRLPVLELLQQVDSTNRHMMRCAAEGGLDGQVCLAEYQSAGQGRRGRAWVSPYACNLYLSLLSRFNDGPAVLSGLSLAIGVAVVRALQACGIGGVGLKWPNDVLWQGRKLAGILLEVAGENDGPCHAVIGVGVNVRMPSVDAHVIDQSWVDVASIRPDVGRNRLAAELIGQLLNAVTQYQREGLNAFHDEWMALDVLQGKGVRLLMAEKETQGVACGVTEQGLLRLEVDGRIHHYSSGEVSIRPLLPSE